MKIYFGKVGEYHYFHQNETLLLADVLIIFRNMCLEIYELYLAHFLSTAVLAWQAALKRGKVKLDLLTDIDVLLMLEKVLEVEYFMLHTDMRKPIMST